MATSRSPSEPQVFFEGTAAQHPLVDTFIETTLSNPPAMVAALGRIGAETTTEAQLAEFVSAHVVERAKALHVVRLLLDSRADRDISFDRTTERRITDDKEHANLMLRREQARNSPDRHERFTRLVRARRLFVWAGRIAAAHETADSQVAAAA